MGIATPIAYRAEMFTFGDQPAPDVKSGNLGFAGFRIHGPINRPDYFDEIGVFLGASYFRAVAKNLTYGLSARGLSLNTADPKGEEFPELPHLLGRAARERRQLARGARAARQRERGGGLSLHHHARARPRSTISRRRCFRACRSSKIGLAPLTSMYFFGANDRVGVDDFRPEVHDSDGLAIAERARRADLAPAQQPARPSGQRLRRQQSARLRPDAARARFPRYEDLEARYRAPPERLRRADRRLGRRRGASRRDPDQRRRSTTTSWRSGARARRRAPRANTPTRIAFTGAPDSRKPLPLAQVVATRIGAGPDETRLSSSTSPART